MGQIPGGVSIPKTMDATNSMNELWRSISAILHHRERETRCNHHRVKTGTVRSRRDIHYESQRWKFQTCYVLPQDHSGKAKCPEIWSHLSKTHHLEEINLALWVSVCSCVEWVSLNSPTRRLTGQWKCLFRGPWDVNNPWAVSWPLGSPPPEPGPISFDKQGNHNVW